MTFDMRNGGGGMTSRSSQTTNYSWSRTRRPQRVWPFNSGLRELALDAACIVLLFTATSALSKFQTIDRLVWLLADLCVVVMLVRWYREFLQVARKSWILLTWPAIATISFLWSLTPEISLYHGLQLFATVLVSFLVTIFARLEKLVPIVFTALLASAMASVAYVLMNPSDGIAMGGEWQGLFAHKNSMGSVMSIFLLTAGCLFLYGWRRRVVAGAMVIAAGLLLLSRSGTAIVALAVTIGVAIVFLVIRWGMIVSALGAGVVLVVAGGGLMVLEVANLDLVPAILGALGKDETLTGRTVLWDIAVAAYESRPWSGFGFKAWWSSDETEAPIIIYLIGNEAGSFHNSIVEVAVAFGTLGPILLIAGLLYCLIVTVRAYLADGRLLLLWPLLTTFYITFTCFAESMLFTNHGFYQLLLVIAAASASRQLGLVQSAQSQGLGRTSQGRQGYAPSSH